MCGIVGLFLKNQSLAPELGTHLESMLIKMSERGPDSAGFAIYDEPVAGTIKLIVRSDAAEPDFRALADQLGPKVEVVPRDNHALLLVPSGTSSRTRCSARRWGRPGARTTSTTTAG